MWSVSFSYACSYKHKKNITIFDNRVQILQKNKKRQRQRPKLGRNRIIKNCKGQKLSYKENENFHSGRWSSKAKMEKEEEKKNPAGEGKLEGLPLEDSPYVKYKDLEDYKRQGYGTEGHLQPKPGRGAGATDAPTVSGGTASSEGNLSATNAINRQGVP
ncbi:Late embryogenesis abundant protein, LEA-18 [Quillaja saponaria]|uniref:Late embryogenesis abundant protein, LEA-18 n=1 Tax=Quillaja saponaria TaxID=32244 RepID=A0AAD7L8N5_QUISA|nr:Late embryogenesis abundant protein, LEA-18 [Quillaja saponaria]